MLELYFEGLDDFNATELEQILQLPWLVWNSMIMQHDEKNKIDYYASINLLLRNQLDARKVVDAMCQRKKVMFEQYDFIFGKYKVNFDHKTNTVSLWVEALEPHLSN